MRPPASASESMRRLLVMNCCIRPWERFVEGEDVVVSVGESSECPPRPPHSGRKTGREVMR